MPVVAYGHYLEAIDPTGLENIILEGFTDNNKAKILPKYQGCAVRFVDYIARFSTYIVNRSTINGEISQDNPQISSPQT